MTESGDLESRIRLASSHHVPGNALPAFAVGAINLGRELYRSATAGRPRVAILVVPTRDFFSTLIALGAAEAALACSTRIAHKPEPGEPVIALYETGGLHVAVFEGETEDTRTPGRMRTRLRLRGDQVISAFSDTITLLRHPKGPDARVALSTFGSSKEAPSEVHTVQQAFGLNALRDLYTDVPASTIIGTKTWIDADMEELRFELVKDTVSEVSLGQLLLTNQSWFLPPLVGVQPYTSTNIKEIDTPLTILDGANVPLRHGADLGKGSQVIVLESTTPEATLELAAGATASHLAFNIPDPNWQPLHESGLLQTERVSYHRRLPQ